MRSKTQIVVGGAVVTLGLLLLVGNLFQVNIWNYLWPLVLIGIGAWVLARPHMPGGRRFTHFMLLGDLRRRGAWKVRDQDIFCLIGDTHLDLTDAEIPLGETTLRLEGFVGGIRVRVPAGVGLKISSTAFLTDAHVDGRKQDYFLTPYEMESDNYQDATQRVRLEILYFVADLRVRQSQSSVEV